MTAKISLEFDGEEAKRGFKDAASELKKTADAGQEMGQRVAQAADAVGKAGDEAKQTASDAKSLDGSLSAVAGGADLD